MGLYFWTFYGFDDKDISALNRLSPADYVRMIYLASFRRWYEDDRLMYGKSTIITLKNLAKVLKVQKRTCDLFVRNVKNAGLINVDENDVIYLSNCFFYKGKIGRRNQDNKMRVYVSAIRELYEQNESATHKHLSYLYKMIPYINRTYHYVCFNPYEKDINKIQMMTLQDFCDIIGYDRSNASKIGASLDKIKIGGRKAISYVMTSYHSKKIVMINPMIYSCCSIEEFNRVILYFNKTDDKDLKEL